MSSLFVKNQLILANNPFFDSYFKSDVLGKLIIISLIILSIISWIIIIHKCWGTYHVRKSSQQFKRNFQMNRQTLLQIDCAEVRNPFQEIYLTIRRHTLDLLKKNQHFVEEEGKGSFLSSSDIDYVDAQLQTTIASQIKGLERNLFMLSTITTLAPFLGLLGTVWGILVSFAEMQANAAGGSQQAVLTGLSLALVTTVIGLVDAIPALVGYNYLKNIIRDYQTEMEGFSTDALAMVEIQYRKVDLS